MNSEIIANMFKALCDKNRVEIMKLLVDGEKCACELLEGLSISQSTLSHHMKILLSSKLVCERKETKWTYYTIDKVKLKECVCVLESFGGTYE